MGPELIFTFPLGIIMLVVLLRHPIIEFNRAISERRVSKRRGDRRITRTRRMIGESNSEDECCEMLDKRSAGDRRDPAKDKRRRERRALERIQKL